MITIYQADSDSSQNDINSAASNNNNSFLALSVDSFLAQPEGGVRREGAVKACLRMLSTVWSTCRGWQETNLLCTVQFNGF